MPNAVNQCKHRARDRTSPSSATEGCAEVEQDRPATTHAGGTDDGSVSFVALGDWGWDCFHSLEELSNTINHAASMRPPQPMHSNAAETNHVAGGGGGNVAQFVLAMGDNFYPDGISSTRDPRVGCWRSLFANNRDALPWFVVPGNHDYYAPNGIETQLALSDDKDANPFQKWIMGSSAGHHHCGGIGERSEEAALCTCGSPADKMPVGGIPPAPPLPPPAVVQHHATRVKRPPPLKIDARPRCLLHEVSRLPWARRSFSVPLSSSTKDAPPSVMSVDLFLLDTCATQFSVRNRHPEVLSEEWPRQVEWLRESLAASSAHWKIVVGHHPLFTQGRGHQDEARCLRGALYTSVNDPLTIRKGMGLLDVLHEGRVDLYMSGHEHAFQLATDTHRGHTLHAVVAGNAMETYYWRGKYCPKFSASSDHSSTFVEGEDEALWALIRRTHPDLEASLGASSPSALISNLRRGLGCPDLDPHRSIFSIDSHVDKEGPPDTKGVLRITATLSAMSLYLISTQGRVVDQHHIKKSPTI